MYIEIRDDGTCIPALVIELRNNPATRRAGFSGGLNLLLVRLADSKCQHDPHSWSNSRTMTNAHMWIYKYWPVLKNRPDGEVVDVRVILGEEIEPAKSQLGPWPQPV